MRHMSWLSEIRWVFLKIYFSFSFPRILAQNNLFFLVEFFLQIMIKVRIMIAISRIIKSSKNGVDSVVTQFQFLYSKLEGSGKSRKFFSFVHSYLKQRMTFLLSLFFLFTCIVMMKLFPSFCVEIFRRWVSHCKIKKLLFYSTKCISSFFICLNIWRSLGDTRQSMNVILYFLEIKSSSISNQCTDFRLFRHSLHTLLGKKTNLLCKFW